MHLPVWAHRLCHSGLRFTRVSTSMSTRNEMAVTGMRSFCRLRCGQLVLKHLNRSKSMALIQYCIFCDQRIRNATVHCLVKCRRWRHFRLDLCKAMSCRPGDSGQVFALGALPADSQPVVEIMCIWAAELDRCCYQFWQEG